MARQRREFSEEFRAKAVALVISTGHSVAHVARDVGINEGTLGNWVLRFRQDHPEQIEASQSAVASSRCIPSGVASPARSASVHEFFRSTGANNPRTYSAARSRGSERANRGAILAWIASKPAAHDCTSDTLR